MSVDRTSIANQAAMLHQTGELHKAILLYDRALDGDPAPSPLIQYFAGMAYLTIGKPRKAEALLAAAAAAIPGRADFLFSHGNALSALKRHARAQTVFTAATALDPDNAALWFNLGNAAEMAGDAECAIVAFTRALDNDPLLTQALPNLVAVLARDKRFERLAALMRQMYRLAMWQPLFYEVSLIGIPAAAEARDDGDVIEATLREMLVENPSDAELRCLLGNFLLMRGEFAEAEACYVAAAETSGQIGAYRAAAVLLAARGEREQAHEYLKQTMEADPEGEQLLKVANLYVHLAKKTPEAVALFDIVREVFTDSEILFDSHTGWLKVISDWKNLARVLEVHIETCETGEFLSNLGACYMNLKEDIVAVKYLRRAVKKDRKNYSAWYNLSVILNQLGRENEAYSAGRKALALQPDTVVAASSLSLIANKLNRIADCERILKRALKYNPDSPVLLNLLGNTMLKRGNMTGGLAYFARARAHAANDGAQFAMQLMAVNYSADVPPEMVAEMHFKWGDSAVAAVKQRDIAPPAALKPRLKVGFLSGDYKGHSCAYFIGPLLANLDPERVEVFCYMTEDHSDDVTQRFRREAKHWREIAKLTDEQAADLIQQDGIDILVELSGHTSGGRLGLMAMKSAPIQVTWLGYPNTTGLPTIDYRFTDAAADPEGVTDRYCREKLYRLPHFLCYEPPEFSPEVASLPSAATGFVTFGCFNNSSKITDEVIGVWARILGRLPDAKMVLKTSNLSDQLALTAFRRKFAKHGIAPERIDCFQGFRNKSDHLMTYGDIDLALDPFPYNGTTTTFESLWMGVPMIALEGKIHAGRVGHSIMTGIGLGELVASSIDEYVDLAVTIANDRQRLARYRKTLRQRLQKSPLMDGKAFAKSMEDAFFDMWHHAVSQTKAGRKAAG